MLEIRLIKGGKRRFDQNGVQLTLCFITNEVLENRRFLGIVQQKIILGKNPNRSLHLLQLFLKFFHRAIEEIVGSGASNVWAGLVSILTGKIGNVIFAVQVVDFFKLSNEIICCETDTTEL
jgi:hypothetical protein